ncbi:MAG: 16S rRNA (guanine(966)-N(2))-methyltransferase RsmD [Candidatus Rhabdochlamydia sp.]
MTLKIIGGSFKGRVLKAPKGDQTRPTMSMVRKAVFDILQQEIEGSIFLDIFAGSGLMGIEALSRGASHSIFIDSHKEAIYTLRTNLEALKVSSNSTVCAQDVMKALSFLTKTKTVCDIIYIDPPYQEKELYQKLLTHFDLSPLLKQGGTLFIEARESSPLELSSQTTPHLKLLSTRNYGSTLLYQLIKE